MPQPSRRTVRWLVALAVFFAAADVLIVVWVAGLPESAVMLGQQACIATARETSGALLYEPQGDYDWAAGGRPTALPQHLTPSLRLKPGQYVLARPLAAWSADAWCAVEGLEAETSILPGGFMALPLYAKTAALRAVRASSIQGPHRRLPEGLQGTRARLNTAFAMEQFELWDLALTGDKGKQTVLWTRWARDSGSLGCCIYRIQDGRPDFLFAQTVAAPPLSDPVVELLPERGARSPAQVLVFEPPMWPVLFAWQGERFDGPMPPLTRDALAKLPGLALWSLRGWLVVAGVIALVVLLVRWIGRRKARACLRDSIKT